MAKVHRSSSENKKGDAGKAAPRTHLLNSVMEALICGGFTNRERQITLTILRMTVGWVDQPDVSISHPDLAEAAMCDLTDQFRGCIRALKRDGVLVETAPASGRRPASYAVAPIEQWSLKRRRENWERAVRFNKLRPSSRSITTHQQSTRKKSSEVQAARLPTNQHATRRSLPDNQHDTAPAENRSVLAHGALTTDWQVSDSLSTSSHKAPNTQSASDLEARTVSNSYNNYLSTTATAAADAAVAAAERDVLENANDDVQRYAERLTAVLNAAIDQRWGKQRRPRQVKSGMRPAAKLLEAGVNIDLAAWIIETGVAQERERINSIEWFKERITKAHEDIEQRALNAADAQEHPLPVRSGVVRHARH